MTRKYSLDLLKKLKERETVVDYKGMPLIMKNLPDSDVKGAMDPRLYEDSKKMLRTLAWMPSGMMNMDMSSEDSLKQLREMFNGVKSVPVVEKNIHIKQMSVTAKDGYEIPIRIYQSETPLPHSPILYYIHGGGFFGGHFGVVEESIKLIVEKSDITAVSVEYRLAPENPYPIGHEDCYSVLKWIYEHAEEYGCDKEKIFVGGDSAGGNLTQYCTTRDWEEGNHHVKGQLLLYPTLNMAGVKDEYYEPSMDQFEMARTQKRGLTKMLKMFAGMSQEMEGILKTSDVNNDYLNPYIRDPKNNPPTFLTAGEHDFLKIETFGYGVKLHKAGVETKAICYKGFGHAYFDNTGVYPQTEDCCEEMAAFILEKSKKLEEKKHE